MRDWEGLAVRFWPHLAAGAVLFGAIFVAWTATQYSKAEEAPLQLLCAEETQVWAHARAQGSPRWSDDVVREWRKRRGCP